jgi:trk system potassium uptake protein TrkH
MLGLVSILLGVSMAFSLPWATPLFGGDWQFERQGFWGLVDSMLVCFVVGFMLRWFGRKSSTQLFRKEAMAVVGLSWILATMLGALPYLLAQVERAPNVPMSTIDAMFEAQSGFSTTGATVMSELEDRRMIPRCILFWRSSTHYLGGLGIMVLFVAILGQGSAGKAMMRAEMPGPSSANPKARMQETAWILFWIYSGLNILLCLLLILEGVPVFDSICHAFGTMATGGFSTYNASVGHFITDPELNGPLIEMTITFFMFLAGTNFILLYLVLVGKMKQVLRDPEWRAYVSILAVATLVIFFSGLVHGDFDQIGTSDIPVTRHQEIKENILSEQQQEAMPEEVPMGQAFRFSIFQTVSIMTTTGFCTDEFENWNSLSRCVLLVLMFVGGCAGSTGGGIKVIRYLFAFKILRQEVELAFHPNVVRPIQMGGKVVHLPHARKRILSYFLLIIMIFVISWGLLLAIEPNSTWEKSEIPIDQKLIDSGSSIAATLNNIGPGLGLIGARQNYGNFTQISKFMFIWLMMLGRLELFVILSLFFPAFWHTH